MLSFSDCLVDRHQHSMVKFFLFLLVSVEFSIQSRQLGSTLVTEGYISVATSLAAPLLPDLVS